MGVLLAKELRLSFVDTDLLIQDAAGMKLFEYQDRYGMSGFRALEEKVLSEMDCENTLIATGGSAVYSEKAMNHLRSIAHVLYLKVGTEELLRRIGDISERGVVIEEGMTFADLVEERRPLYEQFADTTIACDAKSLEELEREIVALGPQLLTK